MNWNYTAFLSDLSPLPPEIVVFFPFQRSFRIYAQNAEPESYQITLRGTLTNGCYNDIDFYLKVLAEGTVIED